MDPFVKICGLRTVDDVRVAVAAGADAVGFVFAESVRRVDVDTARELVRVAGPAVTVGVFAGMPVEVVRDVARRSGIAAVQLHGDYSRDAFAAVADPAWRLVRAVSYRAPELRVGAFGDDLLLVDAPVAGGGEAWDYGTVAASGGRWLLAGGLDAGNVAQARAVSGAWGVDVSSGVESSRGVKDHELIWRFVAAAKGSGPAGADEA